MFRNLFLMDTSSGYKNYLDPSQGSHSHNFLIFLMGGEGVRGIFWVWNFGQKGFFWVYMNERHGEFFWVLYFSSAQINNNTSTIYCWCGIFLGNAKKSRHFLGIFLGRIYEPLSPPPSQSLKYLSGAPG